MNKYLHHLDFYTVMYIILTFAIGIAYINHRFIRMQTTIAIMVSSLILSFAFIIFGRYGMNGFEDQLADTLSRIDFHKLLMNGMLSFLLFAGAMTVEFNDLREYKWEIGTLASLSTVASTLIVGTAIYFLLNALNIHMQFIYCLLFGALISPTDPIAVLGMCKEVNAPRGLNTCVAGESLFNDGVGIVIFLTIYQVAFASGQPTWEQVVGLFFQQAIGGIIYGIFLGIAAYRLMRSVDDHKIQILITIAITTGGYALAEALNISGPLAMVVAGIFIGNRGRNFSMSQKSRESLDTFWEIIDEILNAVLFLLIGFELLILHISKTEIMAAVIAIPVVLAARYITVSVPMSVFKIWRRYSPHTVSVMVWGGLRGGLAVALALALPAGKYRDLILAMTYAVVVFAIVIQGLTIKPLIKLTKEEG